MCRHLSELLGAREPLFSLAVRQLEAASQHAGYDVRLSAEIIGQVHQTARKLGLDPADTTGPELYHALINQARQHDVLLADRLGCSDPADVTSLLPKIVAAADSAVASRQVWAVKKSVAKKLLAAMPPRQLMRHLGYTSADSLVKRENIIELLGAARFMESSAWLTAYNRQYRTLSPSDFEARPLELFVMPPDRWQGTADNLIRQKQHAVTTLKEMGAVIVMPLTLPRLEGLTITLLPLLIHYQNEVKLYSAFFKMQQVRPRFGTILADTLNHDRPQAAVMAGQQVHWRIIQRSFGSASAKHPEVFEPHVQPDDLLWHSAEEALIRLEPALAFWRGLDYVGFMAGKNPVSFNIIDVGMSYCIGAGFDRRLFRHFQGSLWNELFARYMGEPILKQQVLTQLDRSVIKPEALTPS